MTSLPFNILSCEHCIHREKEGQKFTEITPILLTLVHLNFWMWFFSDHPRDSGVMREESDANLSRKFFFTNFALTWSNHRSAWAISGVVSWSEVEVQLNYCMKLSEWLRPAGLPAVIITVLKSKAKLEKRLITGDNDGQYDKLCLFQFWRGAHVLLSTRGLIKYVLLTNRGWFIFNKI